MIKVDRGEYSYFLDGYVYNNLKELKEYAIPNKWDALTTIIGREGTGKSTLGAQLCAFMDKDFNIDKIVFTTRQFKKAVTTFKEESAILWDEAITGADVARFFTKENAEIVSLLTQARRKRLFIVICFPYLFKLQKYYISRSVGLFRVYARGWDDRGFLEFYNNLELNVIYGRTKTQPQYRAVPEMIFYHKRRRSFYGTFSKKFPLDYDEYEKKKEAALTEAKHKHKFTRSELVRALKVVNPKLTNSELSKAVNTSSSNVAQALRVPAT